MNRELQIYSKHVNWLLWTFDIAIHLFCPGLKWRQYILHIFHHGYISSSFLWFSRTIQIGILLKSQKIFLTTYFRNKNRQTWASLLFFFSEVYGKKNISDTHGIINKINLAKIGQISSDGNSVSIPWMCFHYIYKYLYSKCFWSLRTRSTCTVKFIIACLEKYVSCVRTWTSLQTQIDSQ